MLRDMLRYVAQPGTKLPRAPRPGQPPPLGGVGHPRAAPAATSASFKSQKEKNDTRSKNWEETRGGRVDVMEAAAFDRERLRVHEVECALRHRQRLVTTSITNHTCFSDMAHDLEHPQVTDYETYMQKRIDVVEILVAQKKIVLKRTASVVLHGFTFVGRLDVPTWHCNCCNAEVTPSAIHAHSFASSPKVIAANGGTRWIDIDVPHAEIWRRAVCERCEAEGRRGSGR